MLHLPYLPDPNPDEILGSWLARIALHNGQGAWRALLESTGYGSKIATPHFDLVDHSDKLERLLNALGTSYERAIIELSTLPYWLTFDADISKHAHLRGTKNVPRIFRLPGQVEIRSINFLGVERRRGESLRPRACPLCFENDRTTYGEPYWHRSHQLPNVFYCPEHHYPLQTACPSCNRDIVTIAPHLIDLPRLQCTCGHSLHSIQPFIPPSTAQILLADISVHALNYSRFEWNSEHVRMYLRSLLDARGNSLPGEYKSVLSSAFHVTEDSGKNVLFVEIQTHDKSGSMIRIQFKNEFKKAKAPECSALLVALGMNFEQSKQGILQEASKLNIRTRRRTLSAKEITVDSARREILRRSAISPFRQPCVFRIPFWFLRLHDPEWLKQHFPGKTIRRIPSVQADREIINRILNDSRFTPKIRKIKAASTAALIRARFRDPQWVKEQLRNMNRDHRISANDARVKNLNQRALEIANTINELLNEDNKPVLILQATLAGMLGLTIYQVSTTIKHFPHLRLAINKANQNIKQRMHLWDERQSQPYEEKQIIN